MRRALLILLLLATFFVYWPGRGGGFVFDDYPNIVDNVALHVTRLVGNDWVAAAMSSPANNLPRPLAMLSFAINLYFTGLNPVPLKLTNIAIHLLNVLLVFGLARSLVRSLAPASPEQDSRAGWTALFIASYWALHPINVMAVLFVVQRMESLSHVFVFAGLWLYVHGRVRQLRGEAGWGPILIGLVVFTSLGVLVKESAALLPLYAFCTELCVFRFRDGQQRRDHRVLAMYGLVLLVPAILGAAWLIPLALRPDAFSSRDFGLVERLLTELRVVLDYFRWILLPNLGELSVYHDDYQVSRGLLTPPTTLIALLVLSLLAGAAWLSRRRRPLATLGVLWFLAAQALTATIIPLELVFEHRNYFASLGVGLLLADLILLAPTRPATRRIGVAVTLALLIACAGITYLRTSEWSNPVSFAVAEAAKHPKSPRATYYLGWMLASATGYRADSPLVEPAFEAFDRARRLPNSNILPDQAALVLAARTGRPLKRLWWDHMQSRLRERPIGPQERGALGGLMTCALKHYCAFPADDMLATFGAALSRGADPEVLSIYANYVLNVLDDPELALRLWQEAKFLNPSEPQYRISVIKLQIATGQNDQAAAQIVELRGIGRFGQYDRLADELQGRLGSPAPAGLP